MALKNQIKQLNEICSRLEQENQLLKQHATPETLALLGNSSASLAVGHSSVPTTTATTNVVNVPNNNTLSSNQTGQINSVDTIPLNQHNTNNLLPVNQDSMISSFTEHVLTNTGEMLTNIAQSAPVPPSAATSSVSSVTSTNQPQISHNSGNELNQQ